VPTGGREELLAFLKQAQLEHGHLSRQTLLDLSRSLEISPSDVFGVASFYSFLSTRPLGRNLIRICSGVPCYLKNSQMVLESLGCEIGIGPGESTPDGRFSCELTNCIGACDAAPAMLVNDDVHGDLTPEKIAAILRSYR
jgi:NADH:ubiquinone oxidoreductase subunit E